MSLEKPKISVGMPVYNGERYIESAIEATLSQTFGDFELIISDNASTDRTGEICRDFASRDERIRYIRNAENIGAANNYNQLFRESSAEYFRWFNADDDCSEVLHERCFDVLEANPDAVMCYGKTVIIDQSGDVIDHYDDNLDLQQASAVERFLQFRQVVGLTNAIYGLIRRSALANTALMGDSSYPAADTNLMAELVLYGKFIEIPEPLFSRRMHEEASSWNRKDTAAQQTFWSGSGSKFVMPTWKKYIAYLRGINRSPLTRREKKILKRHIYKSMRWQRGPISREFLQMILKVNA